MYKRETRYPRDSPTERPPIYGSEQTRVYDLTCSDLELPISLDLLIRVLVASVILEREKFESLSPNCYLFVLFIAKKRTRLLWIFWEGGL